MDTPERFAAKYTNRPLTARDVVYARRWFVQQHFYQTTPAEFRDSAQAGEFFDTLCEDNAFGVDVLKEWAANMYDLDNLDRVEEYKS